MYIVPCGRQLLLSSGAANVFQAWGAKYFYCILTNYYVEMMIAMNYVDAEKLSRIVCTWY